MTQPDHCDSRSNTCVDSLSGAPPPSPGQRADARPALALRPWRVTRRRRRRRGWPWPEARFRPLIARRDRGAIREPRTGRSWCCVPTGADRYRRACDRGEGSGAARRRNRPAGQPRACSLAAFEPSLHFVDFIHALDDDAAGRGGTSSSRAPRRTLMSMHRMMALSSRPTSTSGCSFPLPATTLATPREHCRNPCCARPAEPGALAALDRAAGLRGCANRSSVTATGVLRRADRVGPRGHQRPALVHEVASGVRPLDGVAHGVGEAQLHHRVVGVGALARPDSERAAEAVHRRIDTGPIQRVNKARIGHRAACAPGEYKVSARGAPRPCFGEDVERTRRQRDAVLASGLHALGGYRPGRHGGLIR